MHKRLGSFAAAIVVSMWGAGCADRNAIGRVSQSVATHLDTVPVKAMGLHLETSGFEYAGYELEAGSGDGDRASLRSPDS